MIDDAEDVLESARAERVIEGGDKVKHDHGDGEDDRADEVSGMSQLYRMQDQERCRHQRCQRSCTVADAVGDLFT